MDSELTSAAYWEDRQKRLVPAKDEGALKDLLDAVEPFRRSYRDQRWIELGCSPGYVSALLLKRIPFVPFGVDFSRTAYLYKQTMAQVAKIEATLFHTDLRDFAPESPFDVVMSYGLIEHFVDPLEILEHHLRLCRSGGLIVVALPHFRKLQWVYHRVFDHSDLRRHNLKVMVLDPFQDFSEKHDLDVLSLRHVGRMSFWNVDDTGPQLVAALRKAVSLIVRGFANLIMSNVLPPHRQLYAPWIVFVAKKR